MHPTNVSREKKLPAGMRPRDGQKEISDGACLAHDTDFFKAASAISYIGDGDVHLRLYC
jgi:hypothetical protein